MTGDIVTSTPWAPFRRLILCIVFLVACITASIPSFRSVQAQDSYQRISGEGSTWSATALNAMRVNVQQFGLTVDFNPTGSTNGRKAFLNGLVDFAASDIPFQFHPEDGSPPENPDPESYAYIPVTAGGTVFIYNLKINGQRVTNLRLSGENVAKIFTGAITKWDDPAIQSDNPGLAMPARDIVPVVRSDGSGSTAQFTSWMIDRQPTIWQDYCDRIGRAPACGSTSFYPFKPPFIGKAGDADVAGYVSSSFAEGAIGYVNYSYALSVEFPVAKVLNAAGYYTEPTPENVAVSLLKAKINTDASDLSVYLTQDLTDVYSDSDPRNYQLSSYSYLILPLKLKGQFTAEKGRSVGAFAYYAMCQAQQQSASLGYSPIPINLVQASFEQIRKIPGAEVQNINVQSCNNPTFSSDGTNTLANNAQQPLECDKQSAAQCPDGTGGARNPTPTKSPSGAIILQWSQAVAAPAAGGSDSPASGGGGNPSGSPAGSVDSPSAASEAPAGGAAPSGANTPAASGAASANTPTGPGGVTSPDAQQSPQACDADTGACGPAVASNSPTAEGTNSPQVGGIVTVTLPQGGSRIALTLLVVLLALGLLVGPALLWQRMSERTR